jgi:hypothetical protein
MYNEMLRCPFAALRASATKKLPCPVILSEVKNLNACQREMLRLRQMLRLRLSMTGGGGAR